MQMRRRGAERGLTLIEILIALIVMVLGVLGILALFPPALQSSRESVEETNAALLGESVAHALTAAFRNATYDPATYEWKVTLGHDLDYSTAKGRYIFKLPPLPPLPLNVIDPHWYHYPGSTTVPAEDPGAKLSGAYLPEEDDRLFQLGGDPWVRATVENVHEVNDPTDSYMQFAFSFDIRKVHTAAHLRTQKNPATNEDYTARELEDMCKLYEVRIWIFRTARQGGTFGSGGTTTATAGAEFRRLIASVTKRIASK